MSAPSVSVIMPAYNVERYVAEALDGITAQTLADWELIVCDDGSRDATRTIVANRAKRDARIRLVTSDANEGVIAARNKAMGLARGRYVAWADADDISEPVRLAAQIAFLKDRSDVDVVGSNVLLVRPDVASSGAATFPETHEQIMDTMLVYQPFHMSSLVFRADTLARTGLPQTGRVYDEFEFFLRLGQTARFHNIQERLVRVRLRDDSLTVTHQKALLLEFLRLKHVGIRRYGMPLTPKVAASYAATVVMLIVPSRLARSIGYFAKRVVQSDRN